ncbi:MAG: hypothetical protein WBD20_11335 [Pirellulaceae bacterium]
MSNTTKTLLLLTLATVCFGSTASAQKFSGFNQNRNSHGSRHNSHDYHHNDSHHGYGHHNYRPTTFCNGTFGYGSYHWYRGYNGHEVADLVRSRAAANLVNAQARTQNEVARSAGMDNSVKALHTYIARRSINTETRFGHLHAQGEYARAAKVEAQLVAHQAGLELHDEEKLTSEEINAVTGRLHWPLLLQMEHFSNARKPVNQIFATRAHVGQINPDHYLPLCNWIEKVSDELTKHVEDYPQADYAEAQSFLRRLVVEARLPAAANVGMRFAAK